MRAPKIGRILLQRQMRQDSRAKLNEIVRTTNKFNEAMPAARSRRKVFQPREEGSGA